MKTLQDSVAIVTGAGSGIGRALAQALASQGAQLALADINSANLEQTRSLLGSAKVRTYTVDVSESSTMESFAHDVEKDFGRASLLINNAGVGFVGTFADSTLEDFDWLFRINFWGLVYGCKFFLPILNRQPEAHIVNISSLFGLIAPREQTFYAASKFAIRGFTQGLREELLGTNVTVSCVFPGGIRTNLTENCRVTNAIRPEDWEQRKKNFVSALSNSPEKAAQVIVQGILKNKARIMVGREAYAFDFLQRFFPVRSPALIQSMLQWRIRDSHPAKVSQGTVSSST
jgi:short-subunit dehydrogenase